ncbi:MAG: hypothetical protein KAR40_00015 [Candidatus Sabulitectum sp.]|nr:hypothetical protein [Candidatus Sabulitectum sp.]
MRRVILFLLALTAVVTASPEEDMNSIIDAVYRADGKTVYEGLTMENREALSMVIAMMSFAPDQVALQLRQQLDVQISPSEVASLDVQKLITVIIDSPFFRRELPGSRDMIFCESHTMRGDTALVYISIANEDSVYGYPMMLQEGSWRIAESFF